MLDVIKEAFTNLGNFIAALDPMKIGVMFFGGIFLALMLGAHRKGKIDWTDIITAKGGNKVSLTKLLQFIGGCTGTWVILYLTMKSTLTSDLFLTYLAYVGAIEGWSKFIAARYGLTNSTTSPNDPLPTTPVTPQPQPTTDSAPSPESLINK